MESPQKLSEAPLAHLRALPFVRRLRLIPVENSADREDDGMIELTTPQGRYRLSVEVKRSYLNRSLANAIIGGQGSFPKRRTESERSTGRIVLARYVSAAIGEQFVNAGISFADDPGNIHLRLGSRYNWTVLGKREPPRLPEAGRTTPATIQLLFQFAINPTSATWTVRDLARAAGISKTKVAQLRQQFLREQTLRGESDFHITPEISDRLVSGYGQILRPKLILGRFRYPDSTVDQFLARLSEATHEQRIAYALTGGPAAEAMQHFYHGSEVPLFINLPNTGIQRALRLLPDRTGPVVVLKPFGQVVFWREFDGRMVAPPWLVYAELLASSDPRAREAADELRRAFLQ